MIVIQTISIYIIIPLFFIKTGSYLIDFIFSNYFLKHLDSKDNMPNISENSVNTYNSVGVVSTSLEGDFVNSPLEVESDIPLLDLLDSIYGINNIELYLLILLIIFILNKKIKIFIEDKIL